jgi:hypothetical protein
MRWRNTYLAQDTAHPLQGSGNGRLPMTYYHWLGREAETIDIEDDGFITVVGLKNFQDFK